MVNKVYRSDAVFNGAAFGVAILETALIASNPALGVNGFEVAVILQLIIALIFDSSGGVISYKLGAVLAVKIGYLLKVLMAIFLGIAFYGAHIENFGLLWLMILMSSISDSIASGCLHIAFRPAYNALSVKNYDVSADYVKALSHHISIRIGFPILIVMFAVLFRFLLDVQLASILAVGGIIFVRLYQLILTIGDFRLFKDEISIQRQPTVRLADASLAMQRVNLGDFVQYILADAIETLILTYIIGLIFRESSIFQQPDISWMGSSIVALLVYAASVLTSIFLAKKLVGVNNVNSLCFLFTSILVSLGLFLVDLFDNYYYPLILYALVGTSLASLVMRMVSNKILSYLDERSAMGFNLICRIVGGILIATTMLVTIYFNQLIGMMYFLVLTAILFVAYLFFSFPSIKAYWKHRARSYFE